MPDEIEVNVEHSSRAMRGAQAKVKSHVMTPRSLIVCSTALRISSGLWSTKKAGVTFISPRSVGDDHTGVNTRFLRRPTPGVQQHGSTSSSPPPLPPHALQQQDKQPPSQASVATLGLRGKR